MIKLHPNNSDLIDFADGLLPVAKSILVSAHCDMCHSCHHKVSLFTKQLSQQTFSSGHNNDKIERDYVTMFDVIIGDSTLVDCRDARVLHPMIKLEGRSFVIPTTLARFVNRMGEWSNIVGKLWQSQVDIGGDYLAHFLYMEKGGWIPEHTHNGSEITLVINGNFADGIQDYACGDFIALNERHVHSPATVDEQGCLVFSILDQPLRFTSGWAKLVNPLSHLHFKVNKHF